MYIHQWELRGAIRVLVRVLDVILRVTIAVPSCYVVDILTTVRGFVFDTSCPSFVDIEE